jgi:hypothetical protein
MSRERDIDRGRQTACLRSAERGANGYDESLARDSPVRLVGGGWSARSTPGRRMTATVPRWSIARTSMLIE